MTLCHNLVSCFLYRPTCCKHADVTTVLFQFQLVIAMVHVQVRKHSGTIEFVYNIIQCRHNCTVCAHGMALFDSLISTFNRISSTDCFRVTSTGESQLLGLSTFSILSSAISFSSSTSSLGLTLKVILLWGCAKRCIAGSTRKSTCTPFIFSSLRGKAFEWLNHYDYDYNYDP